MLVPFMDALSFLVEEVAFFIYDGRLYKQIKGLAMGNKLSQCLADIVTGFAIMEMKEMFEEDKLLFLFKYLDDRSGAMDVDVINNFELLLNANGLSVKREDEDNSVSYLNCKMNRRVDNTIGMAWWQKCYSSKQILNFHSNHPLYMKKNVVKEYINNALKITTDEHLSETIINLMKTLRRISYLDNFFKKLIFNSINDLKKSAAVTSVIGSVDAVFDYEKEILVRSLERICFYNELKYCDLRNVKKFSLNKSITFRFRLIKIYLSGPII